MKTNLTITYTPRSWLDSQGLIDLEKHLKLKPFRIGRKSDMALVQKLGATRDEASVPFLQAAAKYADAPVRAEAFKQIARFTHPRALEFLVQEAKKGDAPSRTLATSELVRHNHPLAVTLIGTHLKNAEDVLWAVRLLRDFTHPSAVRTLHELTLPHRVSHFRVWNLLKTAMPRPDLIPLMTRLASQDRGPDRYEKWRNINHAVNTMNEQGVTHPALTAYACLYPKLRKGAHDVADKPEVVERAFTALMNPAHARHLKNAKAFTLFLTQLRAEPTPGHVK